METDSERVDGPEQVENTKGRLGWSARHGRGREGGRGPVGRKKYPYSKLRCRCVTPKGEEHSFEGEVPPLASRVDRAESVKAPGRDTDKVPRPRRDSLPVSGRPGATLRRYHYSCRERGRTGLTVRVVR